MKNCSITSLPFYDSPNAVVIPILIRKDYIDPCCANDNVYPFPIAVSGEFGGEGFYIKDHIRGAIMMEMISSVMGFPISWTDFEMLRSRDKVVIFDEKEYIIDYFACHQHVFDSIMNDMTLCTSFNKKNAFEKVSFDQYKDYFKDAVKNDGVHKLALTIKPTPIFKNTLPSIVVSSYTIPDNMKEEHMDYLAEIRFINSFLNMTGKEWTKSGIVPYQEDCEDAFTVLKGMFK